jgi:parallel beta-helix repeat protein
MKKKVGIGVGVAAYVILSLAICFDAFDSKEDNAVADENVGTEHIEAESQDTKQDNRIFEQLDNRLEYAATDQKELYVETDDLLVHEEDKRNILTRYSLPVMERMSEDDASEKMTDLQVLRRIEKLGIDTEELYTPEYNWKATYDDSIANVDQAMQLETEVEFDGTMASELNAFLQEHTGEIIKVVAEAVTLDETIQVPSNVVLDGNGAVFQGDARLTYAFLIENEQNIVMKNIVLDGGFEEGIYVIRSDHMLIYNNEITNAAYKAICVMGTCQYINIVNNSVHHNQNGAIFFNGDISKCIIQGNAIYQNFGARNLTAGLVFSSMELDDIYTPYNEFKDIYLYDILESPNNNVIKDNLIQGNHSSGFYSDGGYQNYVINNVIEDNEKEGMCLDYGTFGTYVSANTVQRNGERNRQTDEDLEADFILGLGRLADGSSTAKLPGISLDNAAYNLVCDNNINNNSGSGVKMVRSAYRNLIFSNQIADNNRGVNEAYHGFGIELGHASEPDEPVVGLDFTADYENIVARNLISGAHFSGIYIAVDDYCNDLIDNVIMDCTDFSVENYSDYYNSAVGNNTNVPTLNFPLQ